MMELDSMVIYYSTMSWKVKVRYDGTTFQERTRNLNCAHFSLSRDNQILKFIISRQSNTKFHYLESLEIMNVYNQFLNSRKIYFLPLK